MQTQRMPECSVAMDGGTPTGDQRGIFNSGLNNSLLLRKERFCCMGQCWIPISRILVFNKEPRFPFVAAASWVFLATLPFLECLLELIGLDLFCRCIAFSDGDLGRFDDKVWLSLGDVRVTVQL